MGDLAYRGGGGAKILRGTWTPTAYYNHRPLIIVVEWNTYYLHQNYELPVIINAFGISKHFCVLSHYLIPVVEIWIIKRIAVFSTRDKTV